ncbi:MAG: Ppx/GppA family phosphatase [Nitrospinae bacterium]|nr:Ppx/GppA family phosphatase [Nitrospinota bacterium]
MTHDRFAVMDIGSNTIRILVAERAGAGFRTLHSGQVITRLAEKAHDNGWTLLDGAMERTVEGIARLIGGAAPYKPFRICAAATHAVRQAANKEAFLALVRKKLGFGLHVIPWETEAALSLRGAAMVVGARTPVLLFDIGGGSTEYICRGADGRIHAEGTALGVVRLTETYIKRAPLAMDEYARLETYLQAELRAVAKKLDPARPFTLVGTAGTVTSIAAMIHNVVPFDPERINNLVLLRDAVAGLLRTVGAMTIARRGAVESLQQGREDLIIAGIGITLATMDAFGVDRLTVSDAGIREGLMLAAMNGEVPVDQL